MNSPPLSWDLWLLAFAPVLVLFLLVFSGKVRAQYAALSVVAISAVVAAVAFRAGWQVLAVGIGKGLWLGLWILCVVWPALLLYNIAQVAGLERLGEIFSSILPGRRENLLIVSWVFPAFIQGVAGFGTPIAIAAPLLVAMGYPVTRAVLYPLIGYHWAVTFGSMGSSFYMASLSAHLSQPAQLQFAIRAALLLGVTCLLGGALVLLLDGGRAALREGGRLLLVAGVPMVAMLVVVAVFVPALATLAAGTVGFIACFATAAVVRWRIRSRTPLNVGGGQGRPTPEVDPDANDGRRHPAVVLSPYLYLLGAALPVFIWPVSREWVSSNLLLAPDFPETATGYGVSNPPVDGYTPIAILGHPGFYILLACALAYVTYRRSGLWEKAASGVVLRDWARSLPSSSLSILCLAVVATVLVDAGMVSVLARGAAEVTGPAFPALSPLVGALGSFMTGSTTSSNALFAALQSDVAALLDLEPTVLLAAQTVGGNVGNAIAPVVVLIGLTAVGASERLGEVLRLALPPTAVLLGAVSALTVLAALL